MFHQNWLMLAPVLGVAACAAAPVPAERLASAEAAVRGAAEVGAERTPQASLHLKMARDQVAEARELIKAGNNESASAVLMRAQADAEVSLALARETDARARAAVVLAEAQALRASAR
jgi:hypothetical protein